MSQHFHLGQQHIIKNIGHLLAEHPNLEPEFHCNYHHHGGIKSPRIYLTAAQQEQLMREECENYTEVLGAGNYMWRKEDESKRGLVAGQAKNSEMPSSDNYSK